MIIYFIKLKFLKYFKGYQDLTCINSFMTIRQPDPWIRSCFGENVKFSYNEKEF